MTPLSLSHEKLDKIYNPVYSNNELQGKREGKRTLSKTTHGSFLDPESHKAHFFFTSGVNCNRWFGYIKELLVSFTCDNDMVTMFFTSYLSFRGKY